MTRINRRRSYPLIDPSHQYPFLALILVYNLVVVLYVALTLLLPDILTMQDETVTLEVRAAAAGRILALHTRVWPGMLALLCLIGLHSFRMFHRFVGPLYRFRWAFDQVRSGNLAFRVKLRRKDHLKNEERLFNGMLDALAERVETAQKACAQAASALEALSRQEGQAGGKSLSLLEANIQRLAEATAFFQVHSPPPESVREGSQAKR